MASSTAAYSENALVEQPAIALVAQLGYETANCFHEQGDDDEEAGQVRYC